MGGRGTSSSTASRTLGKPNVQRDDYTNAQENALREYTSNGYKTLNKALASGNLSGKQEKLAKQLDNAIARSGWDETETDTPYMRGGGGFIIGIPSSMSFGSNQEMADYINNNLVGTKTTNAGYTSITTNRLSANMFSMGKKNSVILEYKQIGKGVRGAFVGGGGKKDAISKYPTENETILQRGIKTMPISARVGEDNKVHVQVAIYA